MTIPVERAIVSRQNKAVRTHPPHLQHSEEVNRVISERPCGGVSSLCGCAGIRAFVLCRVYLGHNIEGGASAISNATHQLNEDIRDKEVRLIGSGGEQMGIMSSADALRIADEKGLDLVKISPQATPPVCKLMDYGKYRFEQAKREKESRKNQHVVEIKEIRMSPGIDVGDFNVKLKNALKFLSDGNRVKVSVRFRGREMAHTDIGRKLLDKFAEQCAEIANVDKGAKLEGRNMSMFLSPKK